MCDQFGDCCLFCKRGEEHPDYGVTVAMGGEKYHRSLSNGVVGGPEALRKAQAMDAKLGVADKIRYVEIAPGAYEARFKLGTDNQAEWMKAHKRVDHNAPCGIPCPGDFRRNVPGEFD